MATYRHKTIKRFRIGRFEFKNGFLATINEKDDAEFRALIEKLAESSPRDANSIVEVDAKAAQMAERPVSRVIRGPHTAGNVAAGAKEGGSGPRLTDEEVKRIMDDRQKAAEAESEARLKAAIASQQPKQEAPEKPESETIETKQTDIQGSVESEDAKKDDGKSEEKPAEPETKKSGGINLSKK